MKAKPQKSILKLFYGQVNRLSSRPYRHNRLDPYAPSEIKKQATRIASKFLFSATKTKVCQDSFLKLD